MNRFVDKLQLISCCLCKGVKAQGKMGMLMSVMAGILLFAQMTITHEDWRIVLAIEAGVILVFIIIWVAMVLCVV